MRNIRPIEIEECLVCGREFDKLRMKELFTGRIKYICPECSRLGHRQIDAMKKDRRKTSRGKAIIEQCEKNK